MACAQRRVVTKVPGFAFGEPEVLADRGQVWAVECGDGEGSGDGQGGQGAAGHGGRRNDPRGGGVQVEVPADGFGDRPVGAVGEVEVGVAAARGSRTGRRRVRRVARSGWGACGARWLLCTRHTTVPAVSTVLCAGRSNPAAGGSMFGISRAAPRRRGARASDRPRGPGRRRGRPGSAPRAGGWRGSATTTRHPRGRRPRRGPC
jgi:hypothetical protein